MGIVIEAFIGIGIIVVVVWLVCLQVAVSRDREARRLAQQEEEERLRLTARDRERYTTSEKLRCLSCNIVFDGPLTSDGCPDCHHESFVVLDSTYSAPTAHLGHKEEG